MKTSDQVGATISDKADLRSRITVQRSSRTSKQRAISDRARIHQMLDLVRSHDVVALYLPKPPEPDASALLELAPDTRFLLPVLGKKADGSARREPDWAYWESSAKTRIGIWDIPEPTTPAQGAVELAKASLIVCSALAVDRDGYRCGAGGGWYDRALSYATPDAIVLALVNDDEVLARVPREPHDRRITGWIDELGIHWVPAFATPPVE
ncbi:MAG: 5-formyltetrahydrofolate cyclo-ligase [Propionibacteriaceae bacterium]